MSIFQSKSTNNRLVIVSKKGPVMEKRMMLMYALKHCIFDFVEVKF